MKQMPALTVVIVNYNVRAFLEQCLHSLRAALQGIAAEVVVADNASTDDSMQVLPALFPEVHWLSLPENVGFAQANNHALSVATGAYVLFLNPDTIVPEESLQQALAFMQQQPDAGAAGLRMTDGCGHFLPESRRGFPGIAASFCKLTGLAALFPRSRFFAAYYLGNPAPHLTLRAPVLSGAAMLVRRSLLTQTKGFDPAFFMYGEDIDLSFRLEQVPLPQGSGTYKNYYLGAAGLLHFKGESSRRDLKYLWQFYKAMAQFVRKHYRGFSAGVLQGMLYAGIGIRGAMAMLLLALKRPRGGASRPADAWKYTGRTALCCGNEQDAMAAQAFAKAAAMQDFSATLILNGLDASGVARQSADFEAVVFCPGRGLATATCLTVMQQVPGCRYYFHFPGSTSLVGGAGASGMGLRISLPASQVPKG